MSDEAPRDIDYEAEYNNRARVPDHMAHIAGWQRDAAAYRDAARCDLDLAYGPGERHRLDLFHPGTTIPAARWFCSSMAATGRPSTSRRRAISPAGRTGAA